MPLLPRDELLFRLKRLGFLAAFLLVGLVTYLNIGPLTELRQIQTWVTYHLTLMFTDVRLTGEGAKEALIITGTRSGYFTSKICLMMESIAVAAPLVVLFRKMWIGLVLLLVFAPLVNILRMATNIIIPELRITSFDVIHEITYYVSVLLLIGVMYGLGLIENRLVDKARAKRHGPAAEAPLAGTPAESVPAADDGPGPESPGDSAPAPA